MCLVEMVPCSPFFFFSFLVCGSTSISTCCFTMSYHGPRDNGEGRVGPERTLTPPASAPRSVPIPESLRVAWFLNRTSTSTADATPRTSTTTEDDQPENTTPPPSPSIIQLLRRTPRPRSRSPPPEREGAERNSHPLTPASRRPPLFRPGTFGLTPPTQEATMAIESTIIAALEVVPRHLIRAHVNLILSHHCPLPTLPSVNDPIEADV